MTRRRPRKRTSPSRILRESAARGHLGSVGHFNSSHNFLADPATTAVLTSLVEQSAAWLRAIEDDQYAGDSTGFSTAVYDRWFSQKHGKLCSQNAWVKLHVMVGTVTHAVTSAVVTSEGDCPQLPALLTRTREHHDVRERHDGGVDRAAFLGEWSSIGRVVATARAAPTVAARGANRGANWCWRTAASLGDGRAAEGAHRPQGRDGTGGDQADKSSGRNRGRFRPDASPFTAAIPP